MKARTKFAGPSYLKPIKGQLHIRELHLKPDLLREEERTCNNSRRTMPDGDASRLAFHEVIYMEAAVYTQSLF